MVYVFVNIIWYLIDATYLIKKIHISFKRKLEFFVNFFIANFLYIFNFPIEYEWGYLCIPY